MSKDIYASLKQGLVGCWIPSISGNGLTLPDLSQYGNHGALTNMDASDWVSSGSGRALDFEPSDDRVLITDTRQWHKSDFSFTCWAYFRGAGTSNYGTVISKDSGPSMTWFFLSRDAYSYSGKLSANFYDGANNPSVQSLSVLSLGRWYHLACAVEGNTCSLYVNGIFENSGSISSWTRPTINNFTLGYWQVGNQQRSMDGLLDDAKLYNRALTPSEIRLLASDRGVGFRPSKRLSNFSTRYAYKPPKPRSYGVIRNRDADTSSLKHGLVAAWCPSISGQGNVLPDLIGGNHGTLVSMGPEDWVSSGEGRALDFDGVNDYVEAASIHKLATTYTVCGFVRNDTIIGNGIIAAYRSTTAGNPILFQLDRSIADYRFAIRDDAGLIASAVASSSSIASEWSHVCGVRDNSSIKIYVNGIEKGSNSASFGAITVDSINLGATVSGGTNRSAFLDGQLDDTRIYNRALSESEIKLLASKRGIGLEPRKPKITFTDLGIKKQFSQIRVKDSDTSTLRQGLVGAWCPSLPNGGSGNMLVDQSGYNNHGSLVNMSPDDWVSSQYGRALDFDGVNDYINVADANNLSPASAMSISFWAKPAALPAASNGNRMWAVTKGDTSNFEYECSINSFSTSFGKWNCAYYNLVADSVRARATTADAIAGTWQHVCWTANRNNDLPDIYFNGELSNGATIAVGTPTPGNGTAPLQIGRRANASDVTFNGQLDDLRLYSRILTPSEIRLLASRPGIGLQNPQDDFLYYPFPSGSRRRRLLTGMP